MDIMDMFGEKSTAVEDTQEDVSAANTETTQHEEVQGEDPQIEEQAETSEEPSETTQEIVEPAKEEPKKEREDKGHEIPLHVALDWRDKNKDLERRLKEYERREREAQQNFMAPDPVTDPYGFQKHQEQQFQQALWNQQLQTSHRFAVSQYGPETVEKATQWALERGSNDSAFDFAFTQQHDPVAWVVDQYKREELLNQVKTEPDLDAFVRRRAAELGLMNTPAPTANVNTAVETQPVKKLPGSSIAGRPTSVNKTAPVVDFFDKTFKK